MKTLLRFALLGLFVALATPQAFAAALNPYYADIPSPICGRVDPYVGCYAGGGSGSSGGCPKNTSHSNCMAKCKCEYDAALKECEEENKGLRCRESARMNKDLCEGGCLSDWPPATTVPKG